jgi:hypothetical protein
MRFDIAFEPSTGTIVLIDGEKRYNLPLYLDYWTFHDYIQHWGFTTYDIIDRGNRIHYLMVSFFGPRAKRAIRAIEALRDDNALHLADRILAGASFKNIDMGKAYIQVQDIKKITPYKADDALPKMTIPFNLFYDWHFGEFQELMRD